MNEINFGGISHPGALCVNSKTQQWCIIHDGITLIPLHKNHGSNNEPNKIDSIDDVLNKMPSLCTFAGSPCLHDESAWENYGTESIPNHMCPDSMPEGYLEDLSSHMIECLDEFESPEERH